MLRKLWFNLAYYQKPVWDTGISPPELLSYITNHKPGRALDLGCGTGTNVITLTKSGWQVTGVDFAPHAIRTAKKKVQKNGIKADLRVEDATRLDSITDSFDLILDIGCFHGLSQESRVKYIANLDRLLSPKGTYLLYVFFTDSGSHGPGVTQEDINLLSQNLKLVQRMDSTERGIRPSAWLTFQK
jgi:cyclopropane fatty-acyl-phospholipid synthase-like methyltransferase